MKDEEMAEEYANSVIGCGDGYYEWADIVEAFLAGLKAGRPKWHTPDVPASPINKIVLGYIKDYNAKKLCLVKWNGEWWYDARTWNDKVKLIAWCELPTFDKE